MLTDLEINAKLVEIEDYRGWQKMSTRGISGVFNIITDDALCFQLMVKHRVIPQRLELCEPKGAYTFSAHISEDSSDCKYDKLLNRAIGLSIIAKHAKGDTNAKPNKS